MKLPQILTSLMIPIIAGCGGSITTNMDKTLYQGDFDACYDVQLLHKTTKHQANLKPEERYEEMELVITPRAFVANRYALERVDVKGWPSCTQFKFGDIQARADAQRQHIWFVDKSTGKVIGSADLRTGVTTGPEDKPPAWATADGGEVLAARK